MRFAYVVSIFFPHGLNIICIMISDDLSLSFGFGMCGLWTRCASARLHVLFVPFVYTDIILFHCSNSKTNKKPWTKNGITTSHCRCLLLISLTQSVLPFQLVVSRFSSNVSAVLFQHCRKINILYMITERAMIIMHGTITLQLPVLLKITTQIFAVISSWSFFFACLFIRFGSCFFVFLSRDFSTIIIMMMSCSQGFPSARNELPRAI